MLLNFIKKQLLLQIRNPKELILLIAMPLILIAILGFALGGVMNGESPNIKATIALVENDKEQANIDRLYNELRSWPIPEQQKQMIMKTMDEIPPIVMLKSEVFGSEQLQKHIVLEEIHYTELEEAKKNDQYSAIIEVPKNFTYELLLALISGDKNYPVLNFYANEGKQFSSKMMEDLLINYQKLFTNYLFLEENRLLEDSPIIVNDVIGSVQTVSSKEPIDAIKYYTVGMSVMFVLYIASSISAYAMQEKKNHVFNRIILANASSLSYFGGVFISAVMLAFIQLMVLYSVAAIVFQVHWPNLYAFLLLCFVLSFTVGGITALLTAICFRLNTESLTNFFSNIFVSILAFFGGSFFPSSGLSPIINAIGTITPNGASMKAFLQLLQGYSISDIFPYLLVLLITGIITLAAAVLSFPKRRELV